MDFRGRKSVRSLCAGSENVVKVLERNAAKYTAPLLSPAYSAPPALRPALSFALPPESNMGTPLLVYSDLMSFQTSIHILPS